MALKIYPVTETENRCEAYKVKINGEQAELNTARVSAVPFNRRWPGHQRGLEQTELINFLSCAADEPLKFEITPENPFQEVDIRPKSLGIVPEKTDNGTIVFTLKQPAYFTVEPFGRNNALHIFVDEIADYNINLKNENVIYFGKGEHDAGEIELKSNQTLFIDEGAVVYACVKAKDAENIKIIGRGILDNSRNKEKILFEYNAEGNDTAINNAERQHTVQLEYCTDIEIEGITVRDSLVYNIRPIGCKNLHISNVKIIGCWRYNSDGIDMHNCEDVLIENCFIRTFDDSVCVKGFDCYYDGDIEKAVNEAMYRNGRSYDVFKNVIVRNCVIWNDWGKCLEIGAETRAKEIYNILFEKCDIIHVSGSPLDCCNVDYADVHEVEYRDINVEYDGTVPAPKIQTADNESYINGDGEYCPEIIRVTVEYHPEYSAGGEKRGTNKNIIFKNIRLFGRHKPKIFCKGYDKRHKTENIIIDGLYWNNRLITEPDGILIRGEFTENIIFKAENPSDRENQ